MFDTVEVNSTFYRLPKAEATARWAEQTPPDFRFTIKVSRYATHMKRLTTVEDSAQRLAERIAPLDAAGKTGPWLWQLPPNFKRDDDRLSAALNELPPGRQHTIELRHPSWFCEPVWELLRWHGVAATIGHDARRDLPDVPLTAPFTLIRLHFGARGRRGNYSDAELREWAARVDDLRTEAETHLYFNNDWEAFAPRNAVALRRMLGDTPADP